MDYYRKYLKYKSKHFNEMYKNNKDNMCNRTNLNKCKKMLSNSKNFISYDEAPQKIKNLFLNNTNNNYGINIDDIYFSQDTIFHDFGDVSINRNITDTLYSLLKNELQINDIPTINVAIFKMDNLFRIITLDNRRLFLFKCYSIIKKINLIIDVNIVIPTNADFKKLIPICSEDMNDELSLCYIGNNLEDIKVIYKTMLYYDQIIKLAEDKYNQHS